MVLWKEEINPVELKLWLTYARLCRPYLSPYLAWLFFLEYHLVVNLSTQVCDFSYSEAFANFTSEASKLFELRDTSMWKGQENNVTL